MVTSERSSSNITDPALITHLEALALSAWKPLHQHQVDGWRFGCANGYTRRANAVCPLRCDVTDNTVIQTYIDACEDWYANQQQAVCFKLTPASQPTELDAMLNARGYVFSPGAWVMALDLTSLALQEDDHPAPSRTHATIALEKRFTEHWLHNLCTMNAAHAPHEAVIRQMLAAQNGERYFATLFRGQPPVAVGLAVREGDYVGLFDIVTHAEARRCGHARMLVQSLLKVAAQIGAHMSYLQVVERNTPALALYESLGFRRLYEYWYRQKL